MPSMWLLDEAEIRRLLRARTASPTTEVRASRLRRVQGLRQELRPTLSEIISGKDNVIVMGHRIGDVDSFGSSVGIYRIAKTLDKKCHIVLNDVTTSMQPLVDLFRSNPEYEDDMIISNQQAIDVAGNNTVLVVVDVNKPSITECPELLRFCKTIAGSPQTGCGGNRERNAFIC